MPATLGHLGLQAIVTRGLLPGADLKWIWAACVVPDLPWILQRVVRTALPGVDAYDLRLYAIVQSSFAVSLLLCAALCLFSRRAGRSFVILALGAFLHLLIDALQIKPGNGVLLWAPFDWHVWSAAWIWPEHLISRAVLLFGLAYVVFAWIRLPAIGADLRIPGWRGLAGVVLALVLYAALPLALMPRALTTDPHYIATLRDSETRAGKPIALDRNLVTLGEGADQAQIRSWAGETLILSGDLPARSGKTSLYGRFVTPAHIHADRVHAHPASVRTLASLGGIAIVLLWWGRCLRRAVAGNL